MHTSVRLEEMPIEIIEITPLNPLISKCQIKVCWVGDEPNRNRSVITKDTARKMANSLPGSPIVGYYNEHKEDFEEHNRTIDISNGKFEIKDTTRPYGFVDLNAKVWFAKYLDDGEVEREYLVTEGYIWTGQYPEAQRIIDKGNNHSMELDEKTIDAFWTKENKNIPKLFIINDAIISKLCVLGEDNEPCFEGSNITAPTVQFSFDDNFKEQLFSMMNELKDLLNKGGATVFNRYAVEIGDTLWSALYSFIEKNYPMENEMYYSKYRVEGIYEEGSQKFAILQDRTNLKYYRLNFALDESTGFVPGEGLEEVTKSYTPSSEPQFSIDLVEQYETDYAKKKKDEEDQDKDDKSNQNNNDNNTDGDSSDDNDDDEDEDKKKKKKFSAEEEEEKCPECGKPIDECECDKKAKYSLEEIPEYTELLTKYNALLSRNEELESQIAPLIQFKAQIEKKEKQDMIDSFYMLSDDDKKDVIDNIDTYSLNDIEAKLAIICVRNKVSFNLEEDEKPEGPTTYNLNDVNDDEGTPAWVKAALQVAKTMN